MAARREKIVWPVYKRNAKHNNDKDWEWLRKSDLKLKTEAVLCATQEQALGTNYIKYTIDETANSSVCRVYGEKGEMVGRIVCKFKKLTQEEHARRYDNITQMVDYELHGNYSEHTNDITMPSKKLVKKKEYKVLREGSTQCNHIIETR